MVFKRLRRSFRRSKKEDKAAPESATPEFPEPSAPVEDEAHPEEESSPEVKHVDEKEETEQDTDENEEREEVEAPETSEKDAQASGYNCCGIEIPVP